MKILETKRLVLRVHEERDTAALAAMFADINVMKYCGTGVVLPEEQAVKSVAGWQKYFKDKGYCNWAVEYKDNGQFIGQCGFNELPDKSDIEISYMFAKDYWGKGIATEIVNPTMDYGFNELKLKRVVALVYPENSVSIHIIEKTGMTFEKEAEFWGEKLLMYSKINPELNEQT